MKKVVFAVASLFLAAVALPSFAADAPKDKPKVDCTKKENMAKPECKPADHAKGH